MHTECIFDNIKKEQHFKFILVCTVLEECLTKNICWARSMMATKTKV